MFRKSIFEELNQLSPAKDKDVVVENRADHVLSSSINLLEYIEKHYTEDDAEYLMKRFISSIRGKDPRRFQRALDKIKKVTDED